MNLVCEKGEFGCRKCLFVLQNGKFGLNKGEFYLPKLNIFNCQESNYNSYHI